MGVYATSRVQQRALMTGRWTRFVVISETAERQTGSTRCAFVAPAQQLAEIV